ncbi:MAG: MBL fold metallo-hydrolase [Desulfobacterales bacterium]|nr:MBL fold metallo-hydrolase [Desulfobacterales bacterium]
MTANDHDIVLCALASGSRGNAIYLAGNGNALLIDAGLSGREIEKRLRQQNLDPHNLDAILVTHEHSDHIRGVGVLARRFNLPVHLTAPTHRAVQDRLGHLPAWHYFRPGVGFKLAGFHIHPFALSHDAADPVGFTFACNGLRVGMATDLGVATGLVAERLKGCHLLLVEANHDMAMLMDGPYPWHLKQRIRSRKGHLSNDAAGELLTRIVHPDLRQVVLGHLSETNNSPRIARQTALNALRASSIPIHVAHQDHCSPVLHLSSQQD